MRKKNIALFLIIGIILLVCFTGCKSKKVEGNGEKPISKVDEQRVDEEPATLEDEKDDTEKIMRDFKNIVKGNNEPIVLVNFIDQNIQKVEELDALEMFIDLENTQEGYLEEYTDQLFMEDYQLELMSIFNVSKPDEQLFFDETNIEKIENGNLKELMDKIVKGKYKLLNMEGAFYPIIDYEELKKYEKYLPGEIKSYLDIKSMESNSPTIIDAGLMISFDELSKRMIKVENHIAKYPESMREEELLRLYGVYLRFYLEGIDNTPIYDYETNIIKDEVLSSYKKTANIKDTVTSRIVSEYISIIEDNQNIIDNNVFSKITELYNEAIASLEEHK